MDAQRSPFPALKGRYIYLQEAQLPQRNSASAAHMEEALGHPARSQTTPSGYTYAYGRIRKPQRMYVKRAVH